jgi:hypothetical protein
VGQREFRQLLVSFFQSDLEERVVGVYQAYSDPVSRIVSSYVQDQKRVSIGPLN